MSMVLAYRVRFSDTVMAIGWALVIGLVVAAAGMESGAREI